MNRNSFILGDCLEVLRSIQTETIDAIITDPPYNINYAVWDIFDHIEEITAEWYRILKPSGSILCFSGWSFVVNLISKFDKRFHLNDWIIYDRIKGRGAKKRLVSTREDLLWYVKSNQYTFNKDFAYSNIRKVTGGMGTKNGRLTRALTNVWYDISPIVPWSKEKLKHPTQKPVALGERLVKVFTKENDLILDCFAGSGTFCEASAIHHRSFIGIEKDKEFYEMAKTRLSLYL